MARINQPATGSRTHAGAPAIKSNPLQALRRTVLACLLWEDGFYESGELVADRIARLVKEVYPPDVIELAMQARNHMKLRHVPLLLLREVCRAPRGFNDRIGRALTAVIQRPDEITEFLAIYWKDGRVPLTRQIKKGLGNAFRKFDAYQLAKYNRDGAIKLRDALFMVHAKPANEAQAALWKQLVDGTLPAPDTWEVALSGGADKAETFERLIREGKLGYMALLKNLRNMADAGVSSKLIGDALQAGAAKAKALPFRYIAAARAVPAWEPMIDAAMMEAMGNMQRLPGRTFLLVDVSGSMDAALSAKSDLRRIDAACALAILLRGICEDIQVATFSMRLAGVPPRQGMALRDAIVQSQPHSSTYLGEALQAVNASATYDRIIVITDEQSHDAVGGPKAGTRGYMLNVATSENGVGFGHWTRITGFSEAVVQYIQQLEAEV